MIYRLLVFATLFCVPAPGFADQAYALSGFAKARASGSASVTVALAGELVLRDDRSFGMTISGGGITEEFMGAWLQEGSTITMLIDLEATALDFIEELEEEASLQAGRTVVLTALKTQEKLKIDKRGGVKIALRSQFVFRAQGFSRPLKVKEQIKLTGAPVP